MTAHHHFRKEKPAGRQNAAGLSVISENGNCEFSGGSTATQLHAADRGVA